MDKAATTSTDGVTTLAATPDVAKRSLDPSNLLVQTHITRCIRNG
jgi:hypothetical protein